MSQFDYKESYKRNLPHIQPPGATFFVTFQLAGSLPQSVIAECNKERQWLAHLEKVNPAYHSRVKLNFERAWFAKFESLLDGGTFGPLWLGDDRVAATVAESLHYRDERVYQLKAYSTMKNHVHLVIKLLPISREDQFRLPFFVINHAVAQRLHSVQVQSRLGSRRRILGAESYDHYVRDAEEWNRIVNYVLNNPVKAGYVQNWRDWKWNYRRSSKA